MLISLLCYAAALGMNLFWLWRGDALGVGTQLLIPVLSVTAAGLGVLMRARRIPAREGRRRLYRGALTVLLVYYLIIVGGLLLFGGLFHLDRAWGGAVNLEPFYTIRRFVVHYRRTGSLSSLSNLLGNIAVLAPLGVLLPVLYRPMRRFWLFIPLMAAVAVGIEAFQWRTGLGVADVDDSILNFCGAIISYIPTRLVQMVCRMVERRSKRV
ncbi:MAG: VanZ family protein [Oscillospiraceae bacterium]|nr:VanZ family protein [Oscillospiraceae bacterium]MBO5917180.1 VanZ family protein [Oscillospiraceae bacterium]